MYILQSFLYIFHLVYNLKMSRDKYFSKPNSHAIFTVPDYMYVQ